MKHSLYIAALALALPPATLHAEHTPHPDGAPHRAITDSIFDIDEVVIVAEPKEAVRLRRQPSASISFDKELLAQHAIGQVKGLSACVPNLFIPDYGSRITSAIYLRGIGSRIGTPAVGLYVDHVPFIDKTTYDFSFLDVERVDVLRGPQGTLYGRGAMGGLIRVFTADPFSKRGTDLTLGATTRNGGRRAAVTTHLRPSSTLALSVGAFYDGQEGFFYNRTTGKKADAANAGGGRIRIGFRPTQRLSFDLTSAFEQSAENACPYEWRTEEGTSEGITQNRQSTYRRQMLTTGLTTTWKAPSVTLTSVTSHQWFKDRLFMDQDFIAADIFSLEQRQRMNGLTQELTLRTNRPQRRWQWTTGAFGSYSALNTSCPVDFYTDGMAFLNNQLASVMPERPAMSLCFNDTRLPLVSQFETPSWNVALFHQSTINHLLVKGLSLTIGLRLDYDKHNFRLRSGVATPVAYTYAMPSMNIDHRFESDPRLDNNLHHDTWQLLPKAALTYRLPGTLGNIYATAAKGYRSGGYNLQSYSDLAQTLLRRDMMLSVRDFCIATINAMPLPEAAKQGAIAGIAGQLDPNIPDAPDAAALEYRPEQSWNYELGTHLSLLNGALQADAALFVTNIKDQQLARFAAAGGYGRDIVNAGESRSIGAEASLRTNILDNRLTLTGNYGYVHATFTAGTDYVGKRVPFVPEHTLGLSANFVQPLRHALLRNISGGMEANTAGKLFWDEANTSRQDIYCTLDAHLGVEMAGNVSLTLWARNLTATQYDAFAFSSMGRNYAQRGTPRRFGIDVKVHF